MVDPRVKRVAEILVNHSIRVRKGETVMINTEHEARDLALELYKLILKKGAFPKLSMGLPGAAYHYFKIASEEQLRKFPKIRKYEIDHCDAVISIGAEVNTRELSNIDPKKMALRSAVLKPIHDTIHEKKKWVIFEYPTNALAQDAEMSTEEFEDFVYSASIKDWGKESKKQEKLKQILQKGKTVRIVGKDTDISFSIKGRKAVKCHGQFNMPDGEVFTSVVENSTNGYIAYSFPAIHRGKEVDGIRLWFRNGKVIKAKAKKNQKLLEAMLCLDSGARRIGEFGIGVNYDLKDFVKQILFDEKMGGTVHLALGMSFKESLGKNNSAIHWDMIKDLRKEGAIYIDGKCIQKNGKFTFKF
ncbi:aminopeptidase, partial [Candidatus Woesearchaeota archaeon]|nr:aminopeptidase [Candidatus Woesearchaeota archaeon]